MEGGFFMLYELLRDDLLGMLVGDLLQAGIIKDYGVIKMVDSEMAVRTAYELYDDWAVASQWLEKFEIEELKDEPSDGRLAAVFRLGADYGLWRMQAKDIKSFDDEYERIVFGNINQYPMHDYPWSKPILLFDDTIYWYLMEHNYTMQQAYQVILRIIHELGQIVGVQYHFQLKITT